MEPLLLQRNPDTTRFIPHAALPRRRVEFSHTCLGNPHSLSPVAVYRKKPIRITHRSLLQAACGASLVVFALSSSAWQGLLVISLPIVLACCRRRPVEIAAPKWELG